MLLFQEDGMFWCKKADILRDRKVTASKSQCGNCGDEKRKLKKLKLTFPFSCTLVSFIE